MKAPDNFGREGMTCRENLQSAPEPHETPLSGQIDRSLPMFEGDIIRAKTWDRYLTPDEALTEWNRTTP